MTAILVYSQITAEQCKGRHASLPNAERLDLLLQTTDGNVFRGRGLRVDENAPVAGQIDTTYHRKAGIEAPVAQRLAYTRSMEI